MKIPTLMAGNCFKIQEQELGSFLSLYFHIPFCSKKCPYCHFYVTKTKHDSQQSFFQALKKEVSKNLSLLRSRPIPSLYFGGGTPSQVSIQLLEDFFSFLENLQLPLTADCEITFEANPEDLSKSYLEDLKNLPINRLSIGVQSLDDPTLTILNRQHNSKKAIDAIYQAHACGFTNISIDLMYELPEQTVASWEHTLSEVKKLPITHLSLYNLTIEPQTLFYKKRETLIKTLPEESLSIHMLEKAIATCEKMGLNRYEISAFAKEGFHSRHNTGYWLGRDFLGFGPAAFSYFNTKRFKNISNLNKYIQAIEKNEPAMDFEEQLENEASFRELLAIRLRLCEGALLTQFPSINEKIHLELKKLCHEGFIEYNSFYARLTDKGRLFYDTVASSII